MSYILSSLGPASLQRLEVSQSFYLWEPEVGLGRGDGIAGWRQDRRCHEGVAMSRKFLLIAYQSCPCTSRLFISWHHRFCISTSQAVRINTRPEDSRISQYSFAISFYEEILRQAVARLAMQYACPTWLSRINHAEAIPPMQSKIYNRRCGSHKNKSKYQTAGVLCSKGVNRKSAEIKQCSRLLYFRPSFHFHGTRL